MWCCWRKAALTLPVGWSPTPRRSLTCFRTPVARFPRALPKAIPGHGQRSGRIRPSLMPRWRNRLPRFVISPRLPRVAIRLWSMRLSFPSPGAVVPVTCRSGSGTKSALPHPPVEGWSRPVASGRPEPFDAGAVIRKLFVRRNVHSVVPHACFRTSVVGPRSYRHHHPEVRSWRGFERGLRVGDAGGVEAGRDKGVPYWRQICQPAGFQLPVTGLPGSSELSLRLLGSGPGLRQAI